MNIQPLIEYFSEFIPLDKNEIDFLNRVFKERKIKRRQYILQEGEVCSCNTFIVKGCFRMFFVDESGKEHNLQFGIENWWINDFGSFYSEQPSKLNIEAIENSVILQIKKEDQLKLYIDYPKFNHIFRVLAENSAISSQRRILQNISSTAEERYLDFIKRYPDFFSRISNMQIASYLGITPEFLSIIRKRLSKT